MDTHREGFERLRPAAVAAAILLLASLATPVDAPSQSRGSVRSANRSAGGASYSGARASGSTSYSSTGSSASRSTTATGYGGQTATGTTSVTKSGDQYNVNKNVQSSTGASKSTQKTYTADSGHVDSVERSTQATNKQGQTSSWDGKAERSGYGVEFEGQGTNRYGQSVSADGYGARGPYGSGVTADIHGGSGGNRTVTAAHAYGGPVYVTSMPHGAKPYPYHGNSYYVHGGAYYRPYSYHGVAYYGHMPPPWGVCYPAPPVGAIALTVAGMSLLYADGAYYQTTYVEGATQYQVVVPPAGASIPGTALPADRAAVTLAGTTYYLYGNAFYKPIVVDGKESFVVVTKPAGLVSVKALPADVEPLQKGSLIYFRSKDRYYLPCLDPSGEELFVMVDAPTGAVPATAAAAPAGGAAAAPVSAPSVVSLTVAPGTPLVVRVATELNPALVRAGQRFQGNLDGDLLANGRVLAARGARVYVRVVEAKAGAGGAQPVLVLELTDIEVGGSVVPIATEPSACTGKAANSGKQSAAGATLGTAVDGGPAAAAGSPGTQVTVAPGTALEFRLARPLSVDIAG